jgi:hypothetical protein
MSATEPGIVRFPRYSRFSQLYAAAVSQARRMAWGLSLIPCLTGDDAPRGRHRRPARQVSTATAWPAAHGSRPAPVRRSAACDSQHLRLSHRAQYRSDAFARWSSACARFGRKQTFRNASDAASQSLATVGAREPPLWMAIVVGGLTVHQRQNGIFCRVVWLSSGNAWRSSAARGCSAWSRPVRQRSAGPLRRLRAVPGVDWYSGPGAGAGLNTHRGRQ